MSDLSINSSKKVKEKSPELTKKTSFSTLEKDYKLFRKKSEKSDFANSPVLLEQELKMLAKMKETAEKQGLKDELAKIKDREQAIYTQLANKSFSSLPNVYYSPVSFKGGKTESSLITLEKYIGQVSSRLEGIELDDKSKELSAIMLKNSYSPESTSYILKKSLNLNSVLSQSKFDAIQLMAETGVASSVISQVIDEESFNTKNPDDLDSINLKLCENLCEFKQAGIDDVTSLHAAKFLELGFQSPEKVKKAIIQMQRRNIGFESTINILNTLKVYDAKTKTYFIDMDAVQSILKCKKSMAVTKENERKENDNPIRQLGVSKIYLGKRTMLMKDGKITYIEPEEGETIQSLQEKYNQFVSEREDQLLCEFAQKYKMKDGSIDSKYARILSSLRNAGFSNIGLLDIVDSCVKEDGTIDLEKIEKISTLKKAGALNEDVLMLFTSCQDKQDLENATTLTSAVIDGKTVSQLLPLVKDNPDLVAFFEEFSPLFSQKENLLTLAKHIGLTSETNDENAISVANTLSVVLLSENPNILESEFISTIGDVIAKSKNPNESKVCDEADGIIVVMGKRGCKLNEILQILDKVKDSDGKYDEKISDVAWYMTVQDASLSQIHSVLDACKNSNGIDVDKTEVVLMLLENKVPIERIVKSIAKN